MVKSQKILELLRSWRQARRDGTAVSPENLCADCPELLDELRRQITLVGQLKRRIWQWQAARALGTSISDEELCQGRPELLLPLRRLTRRLEQRASPAPSAPLASSLPGAARASTALPSRKLRFLVASTSLVLVFGLLYVGMTLFVAHSSPSAQKLVPIPSPGFVGEARCFRGHQGRVNAVAITPDGTRIISASDDCTIGLWDVATGAQLRTLAVDAAAVTCLALSRDGRTLVAGNSDGVVQHWDLDAGVVVQAFQMAKGSGIREVALSDDGRHALSRGADDLACLWDLAQGKLVARREVGSFVHHLLLFADGKRPCVVRGNYKVSQVTGMEPTATDRLVVHDLGAKREVALLQTTTTPWLAASARSRLLTWTPNRFTLFDAASGALTNTITTPQQRPYDKLCVSRDGRLAVAGSEPTTLRPESSAKNSDQGAVHRFDMWDLDRGERVGRFEGHTAAVTCAAMDTDRGFVVTGSDDRTIRLWLLPVLEPVVGSDGPK